MKDNVINFESLYDSMQKCKRGVAWKDSVASFYLNGMENILKLDKQLQSGTYKPRQPYKFRITSPKPRDIISVGFRDRIYQRTLNDLIVYPNAVRSFVFDNMACQKGKGTDCARNRLKEFLRKMYCKYGSDFYVLQCDIRGYYPNMRHDAVREKFKRFLDDSSYKQCMAILDWQYAGDTGFNPGSQMVQIAGIALLDELDHYIKERLQIKYYIRYMDDFILFSNDKEFLNHCRSDIEQKLKKIGFEFNIRKTKIFRISKGLLFLGFVFNLTSSGKILIKIDPASVKRERKKLFRLVGLAKRGGISKAKVYECYKSWRSHASKGNSYKLIQRMDRYLKALWEA